MTIDEYKELIKFHILTSSYSIDYKYAAVDMDGDLYLYLIKPVIEHDEIVWSLSGIDNDLGLGVIDPYTYLTKIPPHKDWNKILLKL